MLQIVQILLKAQEMLGLVLQSDCRGVQIFFVRLAVRFM